MTPIKVFIQDNTPIVEYHEDDCTLDKRLQGDCQCNWHIEKHENLSSNDEVEVIVNARRLANTLKVPFVRY